MELNEQSFFTLKNYDYSGEQERKILISRKCLYSICHASESISRKQRCTGRGNI